MVLFDDRVMAERTLPHLRGDNCVSQELARDLPDWQNQLVSHDGRRPD